jgi:hypothetical protein
MGFLTWVRQIGEQLDRQLLGEQQEHPTYDFFMAYLPCQADSAAELHHRLTRQGADVYLDTQHGVDYEEAQYKSRITLALMPPSSDPDQVAGYFQFELATAVRLARVTSHRLLRVYLDDVKPRDGPEEVDVAPGLSAMSGSIDEVVQRALGELENAKASSTPTPVPFWWRELSVASGPGADPARASESSNVREATVTAAPVEARVARVFYSYAHEDERYRERLETQLAVLR